MTSPVYGSTQSLAATTTSGALTLNNPLKTAMRMQVINTGPNLAFIKVGDSANGTVTATTADMPVIVSSAGPITIDLPRGKDRIAAITPTGTATLYFTAVEGDY